MADRCETCGRPLPKPEDNLAEPKAKRVRFTVAVPEGEEGVLDELLEQIVAKYWTEDNGFVEVGARGWRYPPLAWALYTVVTANLEPVEEDERDFPRRMETTHGP